MRRRKQAPPKSRAGQTQIWLCCSALSFNLLMVVGILAILLWNGLGAFWPRTVDLYELADGRRILGELHEREDRPSPEPLPAPAEATDGDGIEAAPSAPASSPGHRVRLKQGNRELTEADFVWIDESEIEKRSRPEDVVVLERTEWGNFYGWAVELRDRESILATGREETWSALQELLVATGRLHDEIREIEKGEIGDLNYRMAKLDRERSRIEYESPSEPELSRLLEDVDRRRAEVGAELDRASKELFALRERADAEVLVMETADGTRQEILASHIVRAFQPNGMTTGDAMAFYLEKAWEFVSADPRESNTEGGIFPAIFGTVLMVFLMTLFVLPLGVLAALYLREYSRDGLLVRTVRVAVNNLAGVPSIVFGVFGLGFFVYLVGGSIDAIFYPETLPTPTFGTGGILWASLTLALLTLPVVIVATEEGLAAVPRALREGSLALGATKWETTYRVVLPAAAPGVLTGMILAMARAAGEVAPLMIVGMVKLAPTLPMDHHAPFFHLDRKFMHLGFHIFDLAFQSPNVEAAKPLVFTTALLLVALVLAMNLTAIAARNYLRKKYASSSV